MRERQKERERERERTSGLSQSMSFFFSSPLILFHVMGPVLRRRNGTEKNTLLLSSYVSYNMLSVLFPSFFLLWFISCHWQIILCMSCM